MNTVYIKDTCFLRVGYRSCAAGCHVAVEGHLQGVAIGGVIEEATKEPPASAGLHHVPVEGRAGLEGQKKDSEILKLSMMLMLRGMTQSHGWYSFPLPH